MREDGKLEGRVSNWLIGAIGQELVDAIYSERESSAIESQSEEPRQRPIVFEIGRAHV